MGHRVAVALEALEKPADATERGRAERVAVVAIGEGDEVVALRGSPVCKAVLHRHFQRALDGGGPVVGEEHAFQRVCREKTRRAAAPVPRRPGWVKPRNETCAACSSWARMAAEITGWAWPWMLVQIDELPSR